MKAQKDDIQRFPLWLTRTFGALISGGSALFIVSIAVFGRQIQWSFAQFYGILVGVSLFALGIGMACSKKGIPMGWKEAARLHQQAQTVPEGLSEQFSTKERLEHLETMEEQGLLSPAEAAAWRQKILAE